MRKRTLKRLVIGAPLVLLVIFAALTLFGRSVGSRPLPWHVAWMAVFGEEGWWKGFEWSVSEGWSKEKVQGVLGDPNWVMFDGRMWNGDEIDLLEERKKESWGYRSPFSESSAPVVRFRDGKVVK